MSTVSFWVNVERARQFRELSRSLKQFGRGDLKKKLRKEIRDASKPVVRDIQSAVRGVQVTSSKGGHARPDRSTGLRERVARATGVSITQNGVRIRVSARKVGPYGESLPKYLDASLGRYDRWRHPVFGRWIPGQPGQQKGQPYFFRTINRHTKDFRKAVYKAMDTVADEITD